MTLYTENSEKWKTLADIDYFTQFVKAWIPFNAWYKNSYPTLDRDSEAISEIKSTHNSFRNRLEALLTVGDNEGATFRSYVGDLHNQLEHKRVDNRGRRITFSAVFVGRNRRKIDKFSYSGITYQAERGPGGHPETEFETRVTNKAGGLIFSYTQVDGFDLDDLKRQRDFCQLSSTQQGHTITCYTAIHPDETRNLLTTPPDCIEMGPYHFVNDIETLCKGIIEVLYQLRNSLFHGSIVPDRATNNVYKPAYHVLYMLVQSL